MKGSLLFLAQCAVLGTALGDGDPPPLPSYNFGITGEPTKVDTAFGNLGELGPEYHVPQERNDTTLSSGGEPQPSKTKELTSVATTTLPITPSSQAGTSDSSKEEITTVRTTDGGEENVSESSPFTTTQGIMGTSPATNSTQTFETTAVSKETSKTIAENTNSSNPINSTTNFTTNPMAPPNPNTPSWKPASTLPPRVTQTPEGTPSQTYHTGSPGSTDIPTLPPGRNETKPGQNSTTPSKPNSSMPLYLNNGNIWLILAVFSVIYMTDIKGN